jgi:Na+/glutamate symporter
LFFFFKATKLSAKTKLGQRCGRDLVLLHLAVEGLFHKQNSNPGGFDLLLEQHASLQNTL